MLSTRVLRHIDFKNLWLGQAISQLGDALYHLVFMFMVDRLTKDPVAVGGVMIIQALPLLILSPFAGVLADRVDRRKIMLWCDILSGLILLIAMGLVMSPIGLQLPVIFLVAGTLAVINTFFLPAKSAAIPRLVPTEDLAEANGLSGATQSLMPMIGLASSALILGAIEKASPNLFFVVALGINALSFVVSAYYVRKLPDLPIDRAGDPPHMMEDLRVGARYVWHQPFVRTVYMMQLGISFFIAPFFMIYMQTNREWFDGRYRTLALIEVAFLAFMLLFMLLVPRFKIRRPGPALVVDILLLGLFVLLMGNTRVLGWYVFWNALCGVVVPFGEVPTSTYIQTVITDDVRGRVNSVNSIVRGGVYPFGILVFGALAGRLGLVGQYWLMGLGLMGSALIGLTCRDFWRAEMPAPQAEEAVSS